MNYDTALRDWTTYCFKSYRNKSFP